MNDKVKSDLAQLELSMEYVLESDERTMSKRFSESGWIYDKIWEWLKVVRKIKNEERANRAE